MKPLSPQCIASCTMLCVSSMIIGIDRIILTHAFWVSIGIVMILSLILWVASTAYLAARVVYMSPSGETICKELMFIRSHIVTTIISATYVAISAKHGLGMWVGNFAIESLALVGITGFVGMLISDYVYQKSGSTIRIPWSPSRNDLMWLGVQALALSGFIGASHMINHT